MHCFDDEPR